jgi:hypothetical protein
VPLGGGANEAGSSRKWRSAGASLTVAAILFTLGVFDLPQNRKNVAIITTSIELMFFAVKHQLRRLGRPHTIGGPGLRDVRADGGGGGRLASPKAPRRLLPQPRTILQSRNATIGLSCCVTDCIARAQRLQSNPHRAEVPVNDTFRLAVTGS